MVVMCDEGAARETFQALMEISNLLNTGLDRTTLTYCVRLCETGAHPEALAKTIKEIKREVESIKQKKENGHD